MDTAQQHLAQALTFEKAGRLADAERLYLQILETQPGHAQASHLLGILRFRQGRNAEALERLDASLRAEPASIEALAHRAIILQVMNRQGEALAAYDKLLALAPGHGEALNNRGIVLRELGRCEEAVASYDAFLSQAPDDAEVLYNRAIALQSLGRADAALAGIEKALALAPGHVNARIKQGDLLCEMARFDAALASYDRALWGRPGDADTLQRRAETLTRLQRFAEALAAYDKLLGKVPDRIDARLDIWNDRASVLRALRRLGEALASYEGILAIAPAHVEALNNRGNVLCELGRFDEALASYDAILEDRPDHAEVWSNRAGALSALKRYDEALACLDKVVALEPGHPTALGHIAGAVIHNGDWKRVADYADDVKAHVAGGTSVIDPLMFMTYCDDPALQRRCAENYTRHHIKIRPRPLWTGTPYRHERIRIAYLSADFGHHPVGRQIAELFERHDRGRFEIHAVSLGRDDGSDVRARIASGVDHFHDADMQAAAAVAQLLRRLEIDIAVDLGGHTRGARPEILSHRPAPVQVNFLGYPGTMGADFIDYIIADPVILPFDRQDFFAEKIVHLPDSYMPNDSRRPIAAIPTRAQAGLPETGFVFCSFNNHWKINPGLFDVWMRLLQAVPASVLWLKEGNDSLRRNFSQEAAARGIAPERLIFADAVPLEEYLARYRLADLFLDTSLYNAHATACDALWAGLPLVTCLGKTFPGRVAASLLTAIGVPELITLSLEDYETLALQLARDPARLQSLRRRIEQNRASHPLFDADRFRRNIEAAYTQMWEIAERGERPRAFAVAASESG